MSRADILLQLLDLECELENCSHDDPFTGIPLSIINERSDIVDKINSLKNKLKTLQIIQA